MTTGQVIDVCAVCLDPLETTKEDDIDAPPRAFPFRRHRDERSGCTVTPCGHVFHDSCIAAWALFRYREHSPISCPVCRKEFHMTSEDLFKKLGVRSSALTFRFVWSCFTSPRVFGWELARRIVSHTLSNEVLWLALYRKRLDHRFLIAFVFDAVVNGFVIAPMACIVRLRREFEVFAMACGLTDVLLQLRTLRLTSVVHNMSGLTRILLCLGLCSPILLNVLTKRSSRTDGMDRFITTISEDEDGFLTTVESTLFDSAALFQTDRSAQSAATRPSIPRNKTIKRFVVDLALNMLGVGLVAVVSRINLRHARI